MKVKGTPVSVCWVLMMMVMVMGTAEICTWA